jgi:glycine cleavage system transcriptional repressor
VGVRPAGGRPRDDGGSRHALTVYGADRPGIVHGVARCLAERGANVVDLETHVIGPAERPVYAMVLDLALPPGAAVDELEAALAATARELGVSCTLRAVEVDIL